MNSNDLCLTREWKRGPARRSVAMATCVGVTLSVLTSLALSYIVWRIRGNGEHLFGRRGFSLR